MGEVSPLIERINLFQSGSSGGVLSCDHGVRASTGIELRIQLSAVAVGTVTNEIAAVDHLF
jgi:hypothetical protein